MSENQEPSAPKAGSEPVQAEATTARVRHVTRYRMPGARRFNRHFRAVRKVFNALLILAILYTLALTKSLLIPFVLAAFLGLGLNPIVAAATRIRVPRALAAVVVMLVLGSGLGAAVVSLAGPAASWLHRAPSMLRHMAPKLRPVTEQLNAATRATQSLVGEHGHTHSGNTTHVAISAWDVLQTTPLVLANILTVALLVFFFLVYGEALLRRLVEISPTFEQKRHNVAIVRSIQIEVSRYLLTTTIINSCLGAITTGWLWWMGVPDPLLWGGVAALANFIPYVGAITTTLLLAGVGLLHFAHTWDGVVPALGFACLTAIEGNLITPMILGHRMRLSPVAILMWLLLWGWLWGIPGALLAVPMLTSTKLITERLRGWEWFSHMVQR
ncbi:AI-2E family transporter [Oleiagrimonas sp. C23AA]|uniref:AI-2E family transporter n=1 Tax=Oleiagrimonas sp. C23AA TaxID=2719047 RepID=UPI00141FAA5A|nr:AI-2E family transporter [Oleiagrimonas sp. C23AA]NII10624.1 AI-2E family transporter [Oleiagrimonas sp. C23AA]